MTTKQNSLIARANLFVTRARMANAHGSAQGRAFRARQVAKDKRDLEARKVQAQLAADAAEAGTAGADPAAEAPAAAAPKATTK